MDQHLIGCPQCRHRAFGVNAAHNVTVMTCESCGHKLVLVAEAGRLIGVESRWPPSPDELRPAIH